MTRYTLTVRGGGRTLVALAGLAPADVADVRRAARWAFGDEGAVIAITTGGARVQERHRGGRWRRVK